MKVFTEIFSSRYARLAGNNIVLPFVLLVAVVFVSGCGEVESPEFVEQEKSRELMPKARKLVSETLLKHFGTSSQLKAPLFLPIDQGGVSGEVESFDGENETKSLVIKLSNKEDKIAPGLSFARLFDEPVPPPEPEDDDEEEDSQENAEEVVQSKEPAEPKVESYDPKTGKLILTNSIPTEDLEGAKFLVNAGTTLRHGQYIYKVQCMHCHGFSGNGKGPTSGYMNPQPRDFRLGKFKFTSTAAGERASQADLERILVQGIAGTFMPSFKLLPEKDRNAVIEYVKYLAMRGELERKLSVEMSFDYSVKAIQEQKEDAEDEEELKEIEDDLKTDFAEFVKYDIADTVFDNLVLIQEDWERANDPSSIVTPSVARPKPTGKSLINPTLTSIENGREIFLSKKAQCVTCHGRLGNGDGVQTRDIHKRPDNTEYPIIGLHDDWGNMTMPRNLNRGIYRGGSRPIDVFRRIHAGVKGTRMIAFGGTGLKDEEIWDVVNYLFEMPNLENGELKKK